MDKKGFFNWLAANRHLSDGSLKTTDRKYSFVEKWLGSEKLTPKVVQDFILYIRKKGLKNSTINGYIRVFALIDKYNEYLGVKSELTKGLEYFPKTTHNPTILSVAEMESIINAPLPSGRRVSVKNPGKWSTGRLEARQNYNNKLYRLFVWSLSASGARIDELASLTKENLHCGIDHNHFQFVQTKTYLDRRVPIPGDLAFALSEFSKDKKPNELVFTTYDGNKIIEQTFNPILREKVRVAGINKHVRAHDFRHSFIMLHIEAGSDILTLCKLVGHASSDTTLGYARFSLDLIEKCAENSPFFAKSLSTERLLDRVAKVIDGLAVTKDRRFSFRKEVRDNSILFEIYVK